MKGWFLKCSLKEITTSSPVQLKGRRASQGKEGNNLERWLEPETPEGIALDSEAVLAGSGECGGFLMTGVTGNGTL